MPRLSRNFTERPHFPGVEGFEEVADFALSWARNPEPGIEDGDGS